MIVFIKKYRIMRIISAIPPIIKNTIDWCVLRRSATTIQSGLLMLLVGALMYHALGFNVFTMFLIGIHGDGGLHCLAAGKPNEPKTPLAHSQWS